MTVESALQDLRTLQRKQQAYAHAQGLLYVDGVTVAPKGTAANRGETMGILSEAEYELTTGKETTELLDFLHEHCDELPQTEKRIVKVMRKNLEEMRLIPVDEYVAFQKHVNDSEAVWHDAKANNDYASFEPYLAKTVETMKKIAGYVKPGTDPYEYWLDAFEEGLTRARCEAFFPALRAKLVPLIARIQAAEPVDDSFLTGGFPVPQQRVFSDYLMDAMKIDRAHCAIAETEHPFTADFSKYDVRITTHYHEDNFVSSMYSVVHEGGHALYELHIGDDLAYTAIGSGVSMAIHESQSRFYENLIGRSRPFVTLIAPKLRELFPQLGAYSEDDVYRAANAARPSLIRTEADELTYCLHVMVRYELEKRLFDDTLTTKELPAAWNALYKEYLGIDVPDDTRGVLQDSHWAGGLFGYFPSYALGSAYGAQMLAKMMETVDADAAVAAGEFGQINGWLEENIWKYGGLYTPAELLDRVLGEPFDAAYYTDYLERKFTEVYRLK